MNPVTFSEAAHRHEPSGGEVTDRSRVAQIALRHVKLRQKHVLADGIDEL